MKRSSTVCLALIAGVLAWDARASAQSLITNGQFNFSTGGWVAAITLDMGSVLFDPSRDADGSSASGSAALASTGVNGGGGVVFSRCFAIEPGARVFWGGRLRYREGETATGQASVGMQFWSGPQCTGDTLLSVGSGNYFTSDGRGVWFENGYPPSPGVAAPAGSASARVLVNHRKTSPGGVLTLNVDGFYVARAGTPLCGGQVPTLLGTDGPDSLSGSPGTDVIAGLGGPDEIAGRGGFDTLCGGGGDDELSGGSGGDVLLGGPGEDTLRGGGGADVLVGGGGIDDCRGGAGNADVADPSCEAQVDVP